MSTLLISITRISVLSDIGLVTSFQGGRNKNVPEDFIRVAASDADESILNKYWNEVVAEIIKEVKQFLTSDSSNDAGVAMSLSMPSNYDTTMDNSINGSLKTYMTNAILSKWFAVTSAESFERYAKIAAAAIQDAHNKLYFRKKPTRTAIPANP